MLKQSDSGQTGGHGRTSDIGPGLVYILGVDRHDEVPLAAVLIQVDLHHLVLGQGHLVKRVCYPRILAGAGREFSVAGTREVRTGQKASLSFKELRKIRRKIRNCYEKSVIIIRTQFVTN